MTVFAFPFPWRVSKLDESRVNIVAANGAVVTEVYPGQVKGAVPSMVIRMALAEQICRALNAASEDHASAVARLVGAA